MMITKGVSSSPPFATIQFGLLLLLYLSHLQSCAASVTKNNSISKEQQQSLSVVGFKREVYQLVNKYSSSYKTHHRSTQQVEKTKLLKDESNDDDDMMDASCELKFLECIAHPKCFSCFTELQANDVDWTVLAANTNCPLILTALEDKFSKCLYLKGDEKEKTLFCNTFDSCVVYDDELNEDDYSEDSKDDASGNNDNQSNSIDIDCKTLKSCDFPGFKANFIGDGICHEFIQGCYNSEICNYDGGDCCPDTCKNKSEYKLCGNDGYWCRDPKSKEYKFPTNSSSKTGNGETYIKPKVNCTKDVETPLNLFQYDSFGDGWESSTVMKINKKGETEILYNGTLHTGYEGSEIICFPKEPACYSVKISGGSWGNDASWKLKPTSVGAREIASGVSPMECQFPVAGGSCENTCLGRANIDLFKDKDYQSFNDLKSCIEDKCIIQNTSCKSDKACSPCMANEPPPYCLANGNYTALVFCSQCNCAKAADEMGRKEYCSAKSKKQNKIKPDENKNGDNDQSGKVAECDYNQRKEGLEGLTLYSQCSNIADTSMLTLFEFDNDNFGLLDEFEKCASAYLENKFDKSALNCMQILQNAIDNPAGSITGNTKDGKTIPTEAIKAIANDLLNNGHDFCDCSSKAFKQTPPCKEFMRFKTILYESIDACNGLDKIDCGAWQEFSRPCKANLKEKFGSVNFMNKNQCAYVHDERCGNIGVFPGFRQLDCSAEVTDESWKFYLDYRSSCLKDVPQIAPTNPKPTPPVPNPTPPITMPVQQPVPIPKPTPKQYIPPENRNKPEIPNTDLGPSSEGYSMPTAKKYVPPEEKSKNHHFRNFILLCIFGGTGYWMYRKRAEFDYGRFRMMRTRARNYPPGYFQDSNSLEMYESLRMEESGTFQPPQLAPHPSAYGGNSGFTG